MRKATLLLALGLAACGDGKKATPPDTTTDPNAVTNPNQTVTPTPGTQDGNTTPQDPNDPNVAYSGPQVVRMGRMMADGNNWLFNWAGSTFTCRPQAASVTISIKAPANRATFSPIMDVFIDGQDTNAPIVLDGNQVAHTVAMPDATTPHNVSFVLRTEANYGVGRLSFQGITASADGTLLPTAAVPARQIEFIGDSITNGYGARSLLHDPVLTRDDGCVIGNGNNSADSSTESSNLAFSTLTANKLSAQFNLVASSGRGVYRNQRTSSDTTGLARPSMGVLWKHTLHPYAGEEIAGSPGVTASIDSSKVPEFADSSWSPAAVVINLGTNDYGTDFDSSAYATAMAALMADVHAKYSNAKIFVVIGPMLTTAGATLVETAVNTAKTQAETAGVAADTIFAVKVDVQDSSTVNGTGCEYHPLPTTHEEVAVQVTAAIQTAMPEWATP